MDLMGTSPENLHARIFHLEERYNALVISSKEILDNILAETDRLKRWMD